MKIFIRAWFVVILILQINLTAKGQQAKYFDHSGKASSQSTAYYSRELKAGTSNYYISKYLNGDPYFEGTILKADDGDESKNTYQGTCTWFHKNGSKRLQRSFDENGVEHGKTIHYYESGKISKIYEFEKGKLKDRKYVEFDEKGSGKRVFEETFVDNSNNWDLYSSDKSFSEIKNNTLVLGSRNKAGTSRFINVNSEGNELSFEASFSKVPKKEINGRYGIIFGFKDWQNYYYFVVKNQSIFIGEVFEGINSTKANGFFSTTLYQKPEKITLKIVALKEKSVFSINGDIQYSSGQIRLQGSGIGPVIEGVGELAFSQLVMKEFNFQGSNAGKVGDDDNYNSSGTGVQLSPEGHIATNFHVVENGKKFEVVFLSNSGYQSYKAEVLSEDKDNDLAILKISDDKFKPTAKLNYQFKQNSPVQVGASVFTIGYPLQSVLGKEPKFTDGKISSKTGYKNSVSSFQTSVPIQPGNSGSPLFNDKGELIGIMNSVVTNTDNVSYAIKANNLQNLIDILPSPPELPSIGFPANTSVENMVSTLSRYVVLIKVQK